jgi:2,3-bisphosphoglycerate-independent phosphoglycerate mutase
MIDPVTKGPHTYHTTNPVPLLFMTNDKIDLQQNGALRDIAPTLLSILNLDQPSQMKGKDLRIKLG